MAHRARYAAAMTAITRRLPFGLSEVVEPNMLGYLLINLCTFCVDLGLLFLLHGKERLPIPIAVTILLRHRSLISYVLNRVFNFRSHAEVGRQLPVFVVVSASNDPIFVLGLHRPAVGGRRLRRARPDHRRLLRGRLPLLHDALGRLPRRLPPKPDTADTGETEAGTAGSTGASARAGARGAPQPVFGPAAKPS